MAFPRDYNTARAVSGERRQVRYATGEDPEDVLVRGHVRCRCGYRMHIKRLSDGPYLNCQAKTRRANDCPGNMIKASRLDREAWRRVVAVLTDPAMVTVGEEGREQLDRTEVEARGPERLIREAGVQEANIAEAVSRGLGGPALDTMLGKLTEVATKRSALEERLAEVEEQRRLLSQQEQAVRGWLESLVETAEELTGLDCQGRRERQQRLAVEVTVGYKGSLRGCRRRSSYPSRRWPWPKPG